MQSTLEGKTVVVTGGTQGIGRAITAMFLEQGATVCAFFRSDRLAADNLRDGLSAHRGRLLVMQVDVRDHGTVEEAFEKLASRVGYPSILVNNAGVQSPAMAFELQESKTWHEVFATNVFGTVFSTKVALRAMKEARWGRIINVSSIAATEGYPLCCPYAASKSSLVGLTRSLAKEVAPHAITVNALLPGIADTRAAAALPREIFNRILSTIPIGRIAASEEIAALACFLASDAASYISGALIPVSGAR